MPTRRVRRGHLRPSTIWMFRVASRSRCVASQPHMIAIRVRRQFESPAPFHKFPTSQYHSCRFTTMASSINNIIQKLDSLSIKPLGTLSHAETSPASWMEVLIATGSAPVSFERIKTLVYKPKTSKNAAPTPVIVIAREQTEANSGGIGKNLNLKDLRVASDDLLTEFFSLDRNSRRWTTIVFSVPMSDEWI